MKQKYNEINVHPSGVIDLALLEDGNIIEAKNFLVNVKIIKFGYSRLKGVQIQMNNEESYYYDSGDVILNFSIYEQLRELRNSILKRGYKSNVKVSSEE